MASLQFGRVCGSVRESRVGQELASAISSRKVTVSAMQQRSTSGGVLRLVGQGGRVAEMTVARSSQTQTAPTSSEEEAAWRRRQEESSAAAEEEGRQAGDSDQWRWTLNWDHITPDLVVGSCPRSPGDIDILTDKAAITAVVNLQSDVCFDALRIPFDDIRQRAIERGVFLARVPVRDFDHGDQAAMLPEAVRVVNLLLTKGHKVYVHCTAGINRAPLVALAYLYFIQGLRRDEAQRMVKQARAIANPYLDCLTEAKRRLLEGRDEELTALATEIYELRCKGECRGDASSDWSGAQARALSRTFAKYLEVDMGMIDTEREILHRKWELEGAQAPPLPEGLQAKLDGAKAMVEEQKAKIGQLKALMEKWEREEEAAEARAQELEVALEKAKSTANSAASSAPSSASASVGQSSSNGAPASRSILSQSNGTASTMNGTTFKPQKPVGK